VPNEVSQKGQKEEKQHLSSRNVLDAMFLSPNDVLMRGLNFVGLDVSKQAKVQRATNIKRFRCHYGSSPLDIAEIWFDLCHADIVAAKIPMKDQTERGFKRFMVAHYWLWTKPKNAELTASQFGLCSREVSGEALWAWLKKIQALKAKKIVWHKGLIDQDGPRIIISVDGVDFGIWEPKNPRFTEILHGAQANSTVLV
jgi:hypothetical protein